MTDGPGIPARRYIEGARKLKYADHGDDYPTPPWAARAFFEHVVPELRQEPGLRFLEPSCGRGHIDRVIGEYGFASTGYDNHDYGRGYGIADYANPETEYPEHDIVLTNPPYALTNLFVRRAMGEATRGLALLMRSLWIVGVGRYNEILKDTPPTVVAVFASGMPATHGKILQKGSALMSHSFFWWDFQKKGEGTKLTWIPPIAKKALEKPEDYE